MQAGTDDAARDFSESLAQVREVVEGTTEEEIRDTERRLLEMAEEHPSAGAVGQFAQAAMAQDEVAPDRLGAAERARLRKQRKRERQGRRAGRRFRR